MDVSHIVGYTVKPKSSVRLTLCGIRAPQQLSPFPRRTMEDFVIMLVVHGAIHLVDEMPDGNEVTTVRKGEIHVIAPGLWQKRVYEPGAQILWLHFNFDRPFECMISSQASKLVNEMYFTKSQKASSSPWMIPRQLSLHAHLDRFKKIHDELLTHTKLWGIEDQGAQQIGGYFVHHLHKVFVEEILSKANVQKISPDFIHVNKAVEFIRLHAHEPISLRHVAKALSLNSSYLARCFQRVTKQTILDFILQTKIATAQDLMKRESYSVKEIAYQTGFRSSTYFGRIFKRFTGKTASRYRKNTGGLGKN